MRSIIIRNWKIDDLPVYRGWLEPYHEWHRFDAPYLLSNTPEEIDAEVERCRSWTEEPPTPLVPRMVVSPPDGPLIGTVNRYGREHQPESISIGIGIYDPSQWNNGLGTAALSLWIEMIHLSYPEIDVVKLATWSGNVGMCRVASKLGFTEVHREVGAYTNEGFAYDRIQFQLILGSQNTL
jgi:putative hydrolase of HD superfamily